MRRAVGWLMVSLGAVAGIAGVGLAGVFGPDNALSSGSHSVTAIGAGFVSAPAAMRFFTPTVEIQVIAADENRELFLGVAHHVDVDDFMADSAYTRVDRVGLPWTFETTAVPGGPLPADPAQLDWWLLKQSGTGSLQVRLPLPKAPVELVLVDPSGDDRLDARVQFEVVVRGTFYAGLGLMLLALGLLTAGWAMRRRPGTTGDPHVRKGAASAVRDLS